MIKQKPILSHSANGKDIHIVSTLINEHNVAVACYNANGDADLVVVTTRVTEEQYQNGEHYDLATTSVEKDDYCGPFVCFDEHEQKNIHRVLSELVK